MTCLDVDGDEAAAGDVGGGLETRSSWPGVSLEEAGPERWRRRGGTRAAGGRCRGRRAVAACASHVNVGPPPQPETTITTNVGECRHRWCKREGITHPDASLPGSWHLNLERVPVPPTPRVGVLARLA
jgi:hypothetical protein